MKKAIARTALTAFIFTLVLAFAAGCSIETKQGEGKLGVAPEATGDIKTDFLNAFFTSNLNGRYTSLRLGVSQAVAGLSSSNTDASDANIAYYNYHAAILPYATDDCIMTLISNTHMNAAVDQFAAGKHMWLVPRDVSYTEKEKTADGATVYDIVVVCEAYEDETQNYLYDVTYKGEMNTVEVDGVEKVSRIYTTERSEGK